MATASSKNIEFQGRALLQWKATLQTQHLLNTWTFQTSPCNWTGVTCRGSLLSHRDHHHFMPTITRIQLSQMGLEGKLETLNFSALPSLRVLNLTANNLHGSIPAAISSLSKLIYLDLSDNNQISGSIPSSLGPIPTEIGNLLNLRDFDISNNQIIGSIPKAIGNLTKLEIFSAIINNINGPLPNEMANLTNLIKLQLGNNNLSGNIPQDLAKGGLLQNLSLIYNNFEGHIPVSLKNSTNLIRVRLEGNQFTGDISESFGIHPLLDYIDLSFNRLSGTLSQSWGACLNLTSFKISGNMITGEIPVEISQMPKLQLLDISSNKLVGNIPREFRRLSYLFHLNMSNNQLSGTIPPEFGDLSSLKILDLSRNKLSGKIPIQIENCFELDLLSLSNNDLSGAIPFQLGNLKLHRVLDLSDNLFTGEVPTQLSKLTELQMLNLSHNELVGRIPSSFQLMRSLTSIDLSYNFLDGPVPQSKIFRRAPIEWFIHNKGLCGEVQGLPPCAPSSWESRDKKITHRNKVIIWVIIPTASILFLLFLIAAIILPYCKRKKHTATETAEVVNGGIFTIWNFNGKEAYKEIIEATENFDDKYRIGVGGYGTVYVATVSSGETFAIKKIHKIEDQASEQAFRNEIQALTQIRHRNIVKLYGFCSTNEFNFLAYEYMERGSVGAILRTQRELLFLLSCCISHLPLGDIGTLLADFFSQDSLNVDGYYNSLLSFIDQAVEEGFIPSARHIFVSASNAKELVKKLEEYSPCHEGVASIFELGSHEKRTWTP
ncbi:hypothetical protein J5N97_024362 [Dioscorea zingiberensis]|uniref:non-specific serine/threonine protein kinase n=1 Tax=Dioscorea zingiberensis TaxID=325984 RepID=A0A9D5C6T2_9LILI|nr:hypothetical protein J5N97_024362 [Dioscorea zingiberensis]